MNAQLLLADAAQAVNGKLYVLGGGWSIVGPHPQPMAIAARVEVDEEGDVHLRIELVDESGEIVTTATEAGAAPVSLEAQTPVRRNPDTPDEAPLVFPFAINFAPIPLEPGRRYEWRLHINGEWQPAWSVAFRTRLAADQSASVEEKAS
jgi:hypothetical protein